MGYLLQPFHLVLILSAVILSGAVGFVPYWMIFKKAGFSPMLSLLMVLPLVKLIVIYTVAFTDWESAPGAGPGLRGFPRPESR